MNLLHDLLLRTTLAELESGPTEGPSSLRRQLRTLACVACSALPNPAERVAALLDCGTLPGPGAVARAWVACAITRGVMLQSPPAPLGALLSKVLSALQEAGASLGATQPPLLPVHVAWLLDTLREGLLCVDQVRRHAFGGGQVSNTLHSNPRCMDSLPTSCSTCCPWSHHRRPAMRGRCCRCCRRCHWPCKAPLSTRGRVGLLPGTHTTRYARTLQCASALHIQQLKPWLALLLPACAAMPQPVQPLFHAVLQVCHFERTRCLFAATSVTPGASLAAASHGHASAGALLEGGASARRPLGAHPPTHAAWWSRRSGWS